MLSLSCPASFSKHLNFGKTIFSLCAGFHIYNRTWKTLFPSNYAPWQLIKSNGANLISRVKDFPANSCDRYPPPTSKEATEDFWSWDGNICSVAIRRLSKSFNSEFRNCSSIISKSPIYKLSVFIVKFLESLPTISSKTTDPQYFVFIGSTVGWEFFGSKEEKMQ